MSVYYGVEFINQNGIVVSCLALSLLTDAERVREVALDYLKNQQVRGARSVRIYRMLPNNLKTLLYSST